MSITTPSKPLITIGFWLSAAGLVLGSIVPPVLAVANQLETATALDFSKYALLAGAVSLGLLGIGKALWDTGHKLATAGAAGQLPQATDDLGDGGPALPPDVAPQPPAEG